MRVFDRIGNVCRCPDATRQVSSLEHAPCTACCTCMCATCSPVISNSLRVVFPIVEDVPTVEEQVGVSSTAVGFLQQGPMFNKPTAEGHHSTTSREGGSLSLFIKAHVRGLPLNKCQRIWVIMKTESSFNKRRAGGRHSIKSNKM